MEARYVGCKSCEMIGIIGVQWSDYMNCQSVPISNAHR